jgi:hypothetical protein
VGTINIKIATCYEAGVKKREMKHTKKRQQAKRRGRENSALDNIKN